MSNFYFSDPEEADLQPFELALLPFKKKLISFVIFFQKFYSLIGDERPSASLVQKLSEELDSVISFVHLFGVVSIAFNSDIEIPVTYILIPDVIEINNHRLSGAKDEIGTLLLPYSASQILLNIREDFTEQGSKAKLISFVIELIQGRVGGSKVKLLVFLKGLVRERFLPAEIVRIILSKTSQNLFEQLQQGNLHPHSLDANANAQPSINGTVATVSSQMDQANEEEEEHAKKYFCSIQ